MTNMNPTRATLIAKLVAVQNHPAHEHRDILTITGCGMTDEQVANHLAACEAQAAAWTPKPRRTRRSA